MAALDASILGNGMWTWFNGPRVLYDPTANKLYVGSLRVRVASTTTARVSIRSWDFDKRTFYAGEPDTNFLNDDHCNPAVCKLASGKILTAYSRHPGDSFSARSTYANDIRTWDTPVQVASGATDDAYAHLFQMGDTARTVYWFFRRGTAARYFQTSTNEGTSWNSPVQFVAQSGERPYLIAEQNGSLRIDFVISTGHPNEVSPCHLYHGYMTVNAAGTREFFKTDGTSLGGDGALPLAPSAFTKVYDDVGNNGWQWDLAIIGGSPVITYATFESSDTVHRYFQARWNGSAWVSEEVTTGDTTATSAYLYAAEPNYSGGVALDPNNVDIVYVSRKYGSGDWRVEQWTHTGTFGSGSWSKTADTSGNTGTVNARPYCPRGLTPTMCLWWEGTYASYTSFTTRIRTSPALNWLASKKPSPVWTPSYGPAGAQFYALIHEGSGTTIRDLIAGRDGSFTGSPTWGTPDGGDFGAFLSGLGTANYINLDTLAAAISTGSFPLWIAVLLKTTSTGTTQQYSVGFGNSADNDPLFGTIHNNAAQTAQAAVWRDAAAVSNQPSGSVSGSNNGEFHVALNYVVSAARCELWWDGVRVAAVTNTTGAVTFDRGAIGALRRGTLSNGFAGEVHAVIVGWGAIPDEDWLATDLIRGQFSGTYSPDSVPLRLSGPRFFSRKV